MDVLPVCPFDREVHLPAVFGIGRLPAVWSGQFSLPAASRPERGDSNQQNDVDTAHVQSPHKHGLDKLIEDTLNKLPKKLERATKLAFLAEDTEGYKILNNAVRMTDYVGRYVLYHHYINNNMSHDDAVASARSEFIDFDLPTHRLIEYGNRIGLLWFTKYQLRFDKSEEYASILNQEDIDCILFYLPKYISNPQLFHNLSDILIEAQGIYGKLIGMEKEVVNMLNKIDHEVFGDCSGD